jgi:hypothetical protein
MQPSTIRLPASLTVLDETADIEVLVYYVQYEDGEVDVLHVELDDDDVTNFFTTDQIVALEDRIKEGVDE